MARLPLAPETLEINVSGEKQITQTVTGVCLRHTDYFTPAQLNRPLSSYRNKVNLICRFIPNVITNMITTQLIKEH